MSDVNKRGLNFFIIQSITKRKFYTLKPKFAKGSPLQLTVPPTTLICTTEIHVERGSLFVCVSQARVSNGL